MRTFIFIFVLGVMSHSFAAEENVPAPRERAIRVLEEIVDKNDGRNEKAVDRAVQTLSTYGDTGIIPVLWGRYEKCLDNEGKVVAILAIGKLGDRSEMGRLRDVFEGTDKFNTLRDLSHPPSAAAGIGLLTLTDRSGIIVMNGYLRGRDRQLQKRALEAFQYTGEGSSIDLIVDLVLKDDNLLIRMTAIDTIVKISKYGDPYAIRSLQELLADSDQKIKTRAAWALGRLGDKSGKALLEDEFAKSKFQPELLKVLYDLGERDKAVALVELLTEELREEERAKTEDILISLKDKSTFPHLIALLKKDNNKAAISAARVLGGLKVEDAVSTMTNNLKHEDEGVRTAFVEALGATGSKKAIPALREVIEEIVELDPYEVRKESFREKAAIALGDLGDDTGVKYFFKRNSGRGQIRPIIRKGEDLARIRNKIVVPFVILAFKDPDGRIETGFIEIIEALERLRAVEAVPVLMGRLKQRRLTPGKPELNLDQTIAVVRFIGRVGKADSVEELLYLLDDRDLKVRLESAISILKLLPEERMESDA